MIIGIEVRVLADSTLEAELTFDGDQQGVVGRFRKPGADVYARRIEDDTPGGLGRTVVGFHERPAQNGVRDIHELLQDHGAPEPVIREWGERIYPALASRIVSTNGHERSGPL